MKINSIKNNFSFKWNYYSPEATKYPNPREESTDGKTQKLKEESLSFLRADILGVPKYEASALGVRTIFALAKFQKRTDNLLRPKRGKNDSKNLGINTIKNKAQDELLPEAVQDLKSAQRLVNNYLEDFGTTSKTNSKKLHLVRLVDDAFRHHTYITDSNSPKTQPVELDGQLYRPYYERKRLSYTPDFFIELPDRDTILEFDGTGRLKDDSNYPLKSITTPKFKINLKDDFTIKSLEVNYDKNPNIPHEARRFYSFLDSQDEFTIRENCKVEQGCPKSSEGFYVFDLSDGNLNYFRKKGFGFLGLDCAFKFSKDKGWQAKILE